MTSDKVKAAIQRVGNAIGCPADEIVEAFCGGPVDKMVLWRELMELLQQADPDKYMMLPVDADGLPIHIGDEMDCEHFGTQEVEGFIHDAVAFTVCDPQPARICTCPAHKTRHHREPTLRDVLCGVLMGFGTRWDEIGAGGERELAGDYADAILRIVEASND